MKRKKYWGIAIFACFHLMIPNQIKAEVNDNIFLNVKENVLGINEYNVECDINEDGTVNVFDVIRVKQGWTSIPERIDKLDADIKLLKELGLGSINVNTDDAEDSEKLSDRINKLESDITHLKELSLACDINEDGKTDLNDTAAIKETGLSIYERIIKLETDIKSLSEKVNDIYSEDISSDVNPEIGCFSSGDSVYCTDKKYKKGYIESIRINFADTATPDTIMLMILDSNFKVVRKIIDSNQTSGSGYREFPVEYYADDEFYIALRAPAAEYQYNDRSEIKSHLWEGEWGIYGYYNEGDMLPVNFINPLNIKFDIDVNYNNNGKENSVNTRRIYSIYDAFRAWTFGDKFAIGIIGDSTTNGDLTSDFTRNALGTDHINKYAYPYILQEYLRETTGNNILRVYNFGFSGKNAEWTLRNFDQMVWDNSNCNDVKMLFISHGINDYAIDKNNNYWYETCLRQIVLQCFNHGVQPVIMTTQAGMEHYSRFSDKQMSLADGINRKIAEEFNLEIIDKNKYTAMFNAYSSASINEIIPDGCHYSDYGHKYVAGMIFAHMIPYTIWCGDEEQVVGLENEKIRTDCVYRSDESYWGEVKVITPTNEFKLEAQLTSGTDKKIMECYVFVSGTKQKELRTYCSTASTQRIVVDGKSVDITDTEQSVSALDLGLHKITVYSGEGNDVKFYGFKLLNAN